MAVFRFQNNPLQVGHKAAMVGVVGLELWGLRQHTKAINYQYL